MITLPLFLLGTAAGILSGLFGIGGGIILVPGLIYFLKFEPIEASWVSLGIFFGCTGGREACPTHASKSLTEIIFTFTHFFRLPNLEY